ncbi:MAG: response regulator transcription factor [Proteobacteria bacterium]|nr:response regulator transcription factor [Pseudomonadota bacterium]
MSQPDPISVMLVDDHLLVRRGFRRMLEDDPQIRVVAEAGDGQEAVDLAQRERPDVIVMDFALPSMNGATAVRKILAAQPHTAILMLSMHPEPHYVRNCLDAGARGYLLKNAMDLELVEAVKTLAAGGTVLDPRLALAPSEQTAPPPELSARELEVLQLIVNGKSNKDIAAILKLSANTVAVHRANIMERLDIHNTAELVVYAIRHGLVSIA